MSDEKVVRLKPVAQVESNHMAEKLMLRAEVLAQDETPIAGYVIVVVRSTGRIQFAHDYNDSSRLVGGLEIAKHDLLAQVVGGGREE